MMAEIALILAVFFHWKPVKCVCPKCTETVDPVPNCTQAKPPAAQQRCAQDCSDSPLCHILIVCVHLLLAANSVYLIYKAVTWISARQPMVTMHNPPTTILDESAPSAAGQPAAPSVHYVQTVTPHQPVQTWYPGTNIAPAPAPAAPAPAPAPAPANDTNNASIL